MTPKTLAAIERWNIVIGIAVVAASLVFWRKDVVAGAALGACLSIVNFMAIRTIVGRSFKAAEASKPALMILLIAKMTALMVIVYLIIRYVPIHMVAFMIGISVFFISILVETFRTPRNGGAA